MAAKVEKTSVSQTSYESGERSINDVDDPSLRTHLQNGETDTERGKQPYLSMSPSETPETGSLKSHQQQTQRPCSQIPTSLCKEAAMVLTICFGQILSMAPLGQVLGPMHIIGASFHETNPAQLSWYLAAYSLTVGTFILVMGRLGDMYGHRLMFSIGFAWLALWSLVAGLSVFAGSQIFFDICRALQGLGGAVLTPNGVALLGMLYEPGPRKAVVFCMFGASAPTGFLTGALFSSLFAQLAWWPWAFFLLAIVASIMVVSTLVFVPVPTAEEEPSITSDDQRDSKIVQEPLLFDWKGAATGVTGLICFNVAWNQAPSAGWSSPYVIVLLVLGILLFLAFVLVERRAACPLVPVKDMSAKVLLVLSCIALGWSGFGVWVYYWFQFVEVIQKATPLDAVAQHSAAIPAAYLAALFVSAIVMRVKASWIMLGASIAFCAGSIITVTTPPTGSVYWKQLFWGVVIMPFGMDMSFPAATLMLSDIVQKRHQGIGASLVVTTVNYSIALGLGIAGTTEVHFNRGGEDILRGYRAAQYAGVVLTAVGICVAMYFVVRDECSSRQTRQSTTTTDNVERAEK